MKRANRIDSVLTSHRHVFEFRSEADCPETLVTALIKLLPHIPSWEWPERMRCGGAHLNGRPALGDVALQVPCRIEYFEPKDKPESIFPVFRESWIVHEDNDLLVVYKPRQLPTLPTREQSVHCLRTYIEAARGRKAHFPSRIDTSAQGLVVAALSERAFSAAQRMTEQRQFDKRYRLAVTPPISWESFDNAARIARDPTHPILRRTVESGGQEARTDFVNLWTGLIAERPASIVEARLHTGRTHQIRVHISAVGHPIIGDNFYGGDTASELHLVSFALAFRHPFSGQSLALTAPRDLLPAWLRCTLP